MGMEDQSRFGPLTDSEKARFLKYGTGSDSSCKWLSGILLLIRNYYRAPSCMIGLRLLDMEDRVDREFLLDGRFRLLASEILAFEEWASQKQIRSKSITGSIMRMEPMTAYSADTLIRFAMDRHDATDMLCSDRIGNPVGTMIASIESVDENRKAPKGTTLANNSISSPYMIRHMAIPVATHPFSSLQGIVNAVCYGCHGNGRVDQSKVSVSPGPDALSLAPLSGTMEYSGPDCNPRLMSRMLDRREFSALAFGDETETIVSMPGVETMGLHAAVSRTIGMLSPLGAYMPLSFANPHGISWRLPVTDYETMSRSVNNGRYKQIIPCIEATGTIVDTGSDLCIASMSRASCTDGFPEPHDGDAHPDTYAMIVDRMSKPQSYPFFEWDECEYGIVPDMADIAWALTFPRQRHSDLHLVRDLMMTVFGMDGSAPTDEAAGLTCAGAWYGFMRTLPLRDPVLSEAMLTLTYMMINIADKLISVSSHLPNGRIGIMLIPSTALDLFFTDLHQELPYGFALQTLFSRSFIGADKTRDPGFKGMALIMPHESAETFPVESERPIPGTIDSAGDLHPDIFMLP